MLFATPIVKEQVKLDPRFNGSKDITSEDLAAIAMERRGLRDLELMRHVNSMLKEAGNGFLAMRLYNGSGERLWLEEKSYTNDSALWKYPPDLFLDPGQWSVIVAQAMPVNGSVVWGNLAIAYKGEESNVAAHWLTTGKDTMVGLFDGKSGSQGRPLSVGFGGRVATIHRGHAGKNVIVDGIYTTSKQFPNPNHNA